MENREREKKVIDLYVSGSTPTYISKQLDINRRSVYRIIERNQISLHDKPKKHGCLVCGVGTSSRRKRCDTCNTKIRRYRAKKAGVDYLGGECNRCGWSGDLSGFDFHHTDGKDFNLGAAKMANTKWSIVKSELDKCELLCVLCHRLEHSDYDNEKLVEIANKSNNDLIFKD